MTTSLVPRPSLSAHNCFCMTFEPQSSFLHLCLLFILYGREPPNQLTYTSGREEGVTSTHFTLGFKGHTKKMFAEREGLGTRLGDYHNLVSIVIQARRFLHYIEETFSVGGSFVTCLLSTSVENVVCQTKNKGNHAECFQLALLVLCLWLTTVIVFNYHYYGDIGIGASVLVDY